MTRKDEWARQIKQAAADNSKAAMFHYIVLSNAEQLKNENAKQFTLDVGMEASYHSEFSKMIKLAKVMDAMGVKLTLK